MVTGNLVGWYYLVPALRVSGQSRTAGGISAWQSCMFLDLTGGRWSQNPVSVLSAGLWFLAAHWGDTVMVSSLSSSWGQTDCPTRTPTITHYTI